MSSKSRARHLRPTSFSTMARSLDERSSKSADAALLPVSSKRKCPCSALLDRVKRSTTVVLGMLRVWTGTEQELTGLMYRQMSGRAGRQGMAGQDSARAQRHRASCHISRRGFDLLGQVIFLDKPFTKAISSCSLALACSCAVCIRLGPRSNNSSRQICRA